MTNCVFPGCLQPAGVDVIPARKDFCKAHEGAKCVYGGVKDLVTGEPKCSLLTIPHSGWCGEHNEICILFDFIHNLRHQEAVQRQMAQKQAAIAYKTLLGGNGKPLNLRQR